MTTLPGANRRWDIFSRRIDDERDAARAAVYELLRAAPAVVRISVDYDGADDQAQIVHLRCYSGERDEIEPSPQLRIALETYLFCVLPLGWQDNEGSRGNMEIDVPEQKARFQHVRRFIGTEDIYFQDPPNGLLAPARPEQ